MEFSVRVVNGPDELAPLVRNLAFALAESGSSLSQEFIDAMGNIIDLTADRTEGELRDIASRFAQMAAHLASLHLVTVPSEDRVEALERLLP